MLRDAMKVPLKVGWLSENDLLVKAATIVGYAYIPGSADEHGCEVLPGPVRLLWGDYLMFTVAQLLELGFESGEFKY